MVLASCLNRRSPTDSAEQARNTMHKIQVRSDTWMAYEDHFFGEPWTMPATVVMVHGNSESSHAWTRWVPHLAGTFRVVRLDLPGFGASSAPPSYNWTVAELAS